MPDSTDNPNATQNEISPLSACPAVFVRDGSVFANSRDVAALFEKEHYNVLRDIRTLMDASGGALKFEEASYVHEQNGQTYESFDMSRDAFTMLAMGFSGKKALTFKLAYIEQFNALEAALKAVDRAKTLSDPMHLRSLLLENVEKVIALEQKVEQDAPKVAFADQVAAAPDAITTGEAAKVLGTGRTRLMAFMRQIGWVTRSNEPYQAKIEAGLLDVKVTNWEHPRDGLRKRITPLVTGKGLRKLHDIFARSQVPA